MGRLQHRYASAAGYPFLSECKRIAIIGSGGVVPAVIGACEDRNKGCRVEVFARNAAALAELADLHQIHIPARSSACG